MTLTKHPQNGFNGFNGSPGAVGLAGPAGQGLPGPQGAAGPCANRTGSSTWSSTFQDISIVGGGDNLSFAFRRISVTYTPQRADGTGGAAVSFSWDVAANREIF